MTAKTEQPAAPAARTAVPAAPAPPQRAGREREDDGVEEALAARAAQGDAGAFDALVTLFSSRVFSVAFRILRDRAEAEDLSQEVFVALYHALPSFRGESRLSTWVYRITRNRCLNRLKFLKRRNVGALADIDDPAVQRDVTDPDTSASSDGAPGGRFSPAKKIEGKQLSALLEQHLLALPEEQRTLVVLRDLEDLSYEEIAEVTGLPLGTVKSRLHRARAELSQRLAPHLDELSS